LDANIDAASEINERRTTICDFVSNGSCLFPECAAIGKSARIMKKNRWAAVRHDSFF